MAGAPGPLPHRWEPISARYPLVELLTAALFVAVTVWLGASWPCRRTSTCAIGVALSAIDLDTKRLPRDRAPSHAVAGVLLLPAVIDDQWEAYLRAVLSGAARSPSPCSPSSTRGHGLRRH